MIKIKKIKKILLDLVFLNFTLIIIAGIFYYYLQSQGKILNKDLYKVSFSKKDNIVCQELESKLPRPNISINKSIIFERTKSELVKNLIFRDVNLNLGIEYLQLVNSAIGSNNDLMIIFQLGHFNILEISAAFSFKKQKQLNQTKIDKIIQLLIEELNKQIEKYTIEKMYEKENFYNQMMNIKEQDRNFINDLIDLKKMNKDKLNELTKKISIVNSYCANNLTLDSIETRYLIKTQKSMFIISTFLIIVIFNIIFLLLVLLKEND